MILSDALMKRLLFSNKCIFSFCFILFTYFSSFAQQTHEIKHDTLSPLESEVKEELKVSEIILEHVMDSHRWHLTKSVVLSLPIIVYTSEKGLDIFSSGHFYEHHKPVEYKGYRITGEKIFLADSGKRVLDLSISKNVVML